PIPSLLPFVPILKGGGEESTVRQALQMLRADEKLSQLETVMAFFATFVLDSALVQQIMRWDMAILQESPWYQQIREEGRREGREEGRQVMLSSIELILEMKFGEEGLQFMPKISQFTDLEQLKNLQRSILTVNTFDELQQFMQRN
ncbi:MAG: transposase, partial [Dolichospermum sp.]|nr:transposase [Dolichospermum sp.]